MRVEAKHFHPMRGHVDDRVIVGFSEGADLSIRAHGVGAWRLVDIDGATVGQVAQGAYELTAMIVQIENDRLSAPCKEPKP